MPLSNCNGIKRIKYDTELLKETEKPTYRWILHSFSELLKSYKTGTNLKSPIFGKKDSRYQWRMLCYPNGMTESDTISIFLTQTTEYDVSVKSTIDVRNSDEETLIQKEFEHMFKKGTNSWGYSSFLKHSDFKVLNNDILIIKVDIIIFFEERVFGTKVLQDLEIAWNNKIVTDVVLKAGDFELPVHKFILCARSPVFAANFQHDTLETSKGMIQIEDIDKETLILLVDFIYTGKITELSYDTAKRLLSAADKYNLTGLIEICEDYLTDELQLSNVIDILLLADLHNITTLRTRSIAFIMENHWKFTNNASLSIIAEKSPKLLLDITENLFRKLSSATKSYV